MDSLTLISFLNFLNKLNLSNNRKTTIIKLNKIFLEKIGKHYISITYFDIINFLNFLNEKDFYNYSEAFYYFYVKFLGKYYKF